MAITNGLKVFGENTTNLLSSEDYTSNTQRTGGVQSGQVISSALHNTVLQNLSILVKNMVDALMSKSTYSSSVTFDVRMTEANALSGFQALFGGLDVNSAKKWATSRNFTIKDADETNAGTAVGVNGSGNVVLKLPSTIKASITGNCSGSSGSCTGNAATSTTAGKLSTVHTFNVVDSTNTHQGTAQNFDGTQDVLIVLPATIDALVSKASKLNTARTISLGSDLSGNVSFDGSANVTLNATIANSSVTNAKLQHSSITLGITACSLGQTVSTIEGLSRVQAATLDSTSDRRLKKDIKSYKPKKSILDLPIVEFDFITDGSHHIGCLAQDLKKICPEIVHKDSKGWLTIEETKLVYLLLDEVKKLRKEVDELRGK